MTLGSRSNVTWVVGRSYTLTLPVVSGETFGSVQYELRQTSPTSSSQRLSHWSTWTRNMNVITVSQVLSSYAGGGGSIPSGRVHSFRWIARDKVGGVTIQEVSTDFTITIN